uniref:Uncharacterized protein n=1 Tax=Aegilops tauschii subsp. strangulata TaxID=200361 RepID=A0A453KEK5_AEGTS
REKRQYTKNGWENEVSSVLFSAREMGSVNLCMNWNLPKSEHASLVDESRFFSFSTVSVKRWWCGGGGRRIDLDRRHRAGRRQAPYKSGHQHLLAGVVGARQGTSPFSLHHHHPQIPSSSLPTPTHQRTSHSAPARRRRRSHHKPPPCRPHPTRPPPPRRLPPPRRPPSRARATPWGWTPSPPPAGPSSPRPAAPRSPRSPAPSPSSRSSCTARTRAPSRSSPSTTTSTRTPTSTTSPASPPSSCPRPPATSPTAAGSSTTNPSPSTGRKSATSSPSSSPASPTAATTIYGSTGNGAAQQLLPPHVRRQEVHGEDEGEAAHVRGGLAQQEPVLLAGVHGAVHLEQGEEEGGQTGIKHHLPRQGVPRHARVLLGAIPCRVQL